MLMISYVNPMGPYLLTVWETIRRLSVCLLREQNINKHFQHSLCELQQLIETNYSLMIVFLLLD